jgi:hypothetical protein
VTDWIGWEIVDRGSFGVEDTNSVPSLRLDVGYIIQHHHFKPPSSTLRAYLAHSKRPAFKHPVLAVCSLFLITPQGLLVHSSETVAQELSKGGR